MAKATKYEREKKKITERKIYVNDLFLFISSPFSYLNNQAKRMERIKKIFPLRRHNNNNKIKKYIEMHKEKSL